MTKVRESQTQSPAFNTDRHMTSASIRVTTVFEIETRDLRTTLYKKASLMLQPVAKIIDTLYHILALLEEKL